MTQAAAWLVRVSENFAHSMVVLREAKNVKFGQFLQPGQTLVVSAKMVSRTDSEEVLKTEGTIDGQSRIRAQLTLACYNLEEKTTHQKIFDQKLVKESKEELALLWPKFIEQEN